MTNLPKTILVCGATGQQGKSVAVALQASGFSVRVMLRDPGARRALELASSGMHIVRGDFNDPISLHSAAAGAYGVFSVQPSSGQPGSGVTDDDEVRFGCDMADAARAAGVQHFIYSSANASGQPVGVGHFDSKTRIEAYVSSLSFVSTIVRPSAFMELLLMPGFSVNPDGVSFFMHPDQTMQFIAVEDIGKLVAGMFANPAFGGKAVELAGDALTGSMVASALTAAAGRRVRYKRFPPQMLRDISLLGKLARIVDDGPLAGRADLQKLRASHPGLLTFAGWLRGSGQPLLQKALGIMEAEPRQQGTPG